MKCKRIFKVVSALALTVALMVSTGVVSFAATYTTTTTYLSQDTIKVTSVASDLETGDMATYVAYNGDEGFSESSAVYIDQATAVTGEDITFEYQTDSDNVNATVKFGGSTEETAVDPDVLGLTVEITVNGVVYGTVQGVPTVSVDPAYEDEYLAREFKVTFEEDHAVDTVSYLATNATTATTVEAWYVKDGAIVVMSNVIQENGTLAITTKAVETEVKLGTVNGVEGAITAFAKAIGDDADYGVLIGGEAKLDGAVAWDTESVDFTTTTVKLPALGKGANGGFCVELQDETFTAGNAYKVAAYAGTNVTAVKSVTIATSAE